MNHETAVPSGIFRNNKIKLNVEKIKKKISEY